MTTFTVSGSTVSTSVTLLAGDTMSVFAGGTVSATSVNSGANLDVYGGGVAVDTTVNYEGSMTVSSGGTLIGTTVNYLASLSLDSGAHTTSTTIVNSATFVVHSGAVANDATVNYGATLEVSGGTVSQALILKGEDTVFAGGVVSAATLENAADLVISSGGAVHGVNLAAYYGGSETVLAGGSADTTLIGAGSVVLVSAGGSVADMTVSSGALHLGSGAIASGFIDFETMSSRLIIDGTAMPGATISGFVSGRIIDLTSIASGTARLGAGNVLSVTEGAHVYTLQLDPRANYAGATFSTVASGGGLVLSTSQPACFLGGTLIATEDGDVPVEALVPGRRVRTADGALLPVGWLGVSTVAMRFMDPLRALPIRIRAGALGDGLPARDLLLSPGHAVLIDGLLVHAGALVNGVTIVREPWMPERFRYYHVELPTHAVLLAEGAPSESYLDGAEPMLFDNEAARVAPAVAVELPYPRVKSARQLPHALRARLADRAAHLFSRRPAA